MKANNSIVTQESIAYINYVLAKLQRLKQNNIKSLQLANTNHYAVDSWNKTSLSSRSVFFGIPYAYVQMIKELGKSKQTSIVVEKDFWLFEHYQQDIKGYDTTNNTYLTADPTIHELFIKAPEGYSGNYTWVKFYKRDTYPQNIHNNPLDYWFPIDMQDFVHAFPVDGSDPTFNLVLDFYQTKEGVYIRHGGTQMLLDGTPINYKMKAIVTFFKDGVI